MHIWHKVAAQNFSYGLACSWVIGEKASVELIKSLVSYLFSLEVEHNISLSHSSNDDFGWYIRNALYRSNHS